MAPVAYYLWQYVLRFDPQDPIWPNRDRFVLSAGHASMLLYSLLHLTGVKAVSKDYEPLGEPSVPLEDDQAVPPAAQPLSRAIRSTAGPRASRPRPARSARALANSVGMAIAEPLDGRPLQPPRLRRPDRLQRLRPLRRRLHDGGHLLRGRLARRPLEALEPLLDLRQQPHHDRRQHRAGLHRGRRHPLPGLRLERHPRRRRQRPRPCSSAPSTSSRHDATGRR